MTEKKRDSSERRRSPKPWSFSGDAFRLKGDKGVSELVPVVSMEQVVGMDVAVGSAAMVMQVLMNEVHFEEKFFVVKQIVRLARLFNRVIFRQYRYPASQLAYQ